MLATSLQRQTNWWLQNALYRNGVPTGLTDAIANFGKAPMTVRNFPTLDRPNCFGSRRFTTQLVPLAVCVALKSGAASGEVPRSLTSSSQFTNEFLATPKTIFAGNHRRKDQDETFDFTH